MPIELPMARTVAAKIHTQFPHTDAPAIEQMIDAAFWASLRREEGLTPTISLAYLSPEQSSGPILFERPLPLQPESLARLAPAVERPGIHLGVWRHNGELSVWGATRALPEDCFVLEVIAPGLLVVKQPGNDDSAKFVNVAVLEGDQAKILSTAATAPPGSPAMVKTLLGLDEISLVLVELAVSMRKHRRGGALLVVPSSDGHWHESIVQPMTYRVSPTYAELAGLLGNYEARGRRWQDAMHRAVETIAGLTAVDGATIITENCELLSFGAKITRREQAPRVDQVAASELIEGAEVQIIHPTQLGGTRHLSAAQFAQDQRDAVALVASQDGRFTVFAWSASLEMVHAYRVETFLV
ncbi:MAG: putative sensor domain DACNV-containing protein [Bryobacteraceae bacterium]